MQNYQDRRQAAREAVREAGLEPIMAEDLAAKAGAPRDVVLVEGLLNCDAVVGIYGNRYGWTGAKSGISPTEEEYDEARRLWKPIYAFIDRMQSGQFEARQRQFIDKVENWDVGVVRNEFRSLEELKQKMKQTLTGSDLSPRYRGFLTQIRLHAARQGYREIMETRLPAFDVLSHKPDVQFVHLEKCIALLNGDRNNPQQVKQIASLWKTTLQDHFQPSNWKQTGIEAAMVLAVEKNPFKLTPEMLPRDRSASFGGFYGLLVNLGTAQVSHPSLRLKDRGIQELWIKPILQPALSALPRA